MNVEFSLSDRIVGSIHLEPKFANCLQAELRPGGRLGPG